MKRTHCEGCGITVPEGEEAHGDIRITVIEVQSRDRRDWVQKRDNATHTAHLCGLCREQLLHTFFAVEPNREGEIPSFILPTPALR